MYNWFETEIKYEKTAEEGKIVKVSQIDLVDALSFTEAEARITKEMQPFISGEFVVDSIKRARINELMDKYDGDKLYKVKTIFISLDEEKGTSKRIAAQMLVRANNIEEARANHDDGMKGSMATWEAEIIKETKIDSIYKYDAPTDSKK